jgi:hypothetical protein
MTTELILTLMRWESFSFSIFKSRNVLSLIHVRHECLQGPREILAAQYLHGDVPTRVGHCGQKEALRFLVALSVVRVSLDLE